MVSKVAKVAKVANGKQTRSRKLRKVSLYRGNESIMSYSQHESDSMFSALNALRREFHRNPGLTHAVVTDRSGRSWLVQRDVGTLKVLWLTLRIK